MLPAAFGGAVLFLADPPDERAVVRESAAWRAAAQENWAGALAAFVAAEVVLIALSLPVGIWMSVLAGFLFGTWIGTAAVGVAGTAGAVLAFLCARYVFSDAIHRAARTRPRLNRWLTAIDRGLCEHGGYYVLLLRLTPVIPFWFLNLGLGVTRVRLRDYWWATQLGVLPVVSSCQLSVVSCQLSVVSCQLSVVSCQFSVVSSQLSVVSCQLSVEGSGA